MPQRLWSWTRLLAVALILTVACRAADQQETAENTPQPTPAPVNTCGLIDLTTCAPVQASSLSSTIPPDICNPNLQGWTPNQAGFDILSWQTFVALSWPADLSQGRGVPDNSKRIGAVDGNGNTLPVVWDTYKQNYEVFQPQNPSWTLTDADWNKWGPPPPGCPSAPAGTPVLRLTAKSPPELARAVTKAMRSTGMLGDDVNEAFTGPLVDQAGNLVRYNVQMNQTEFDQIVDGNYYKPGADTSGLIWYDNTTDTQFKLGVIEVKSAWKVLSDAEWNGHTFYQREVLIYNEATGNSPASCTFQKMGLVGLHIAHKTASAPDWFWATFEHKSNVPETANATGTYSFYNPACQPAVTPAQCATAAQSAPNSDPQYQCCQNLQRYKAIGPPPDDPYNMQRGPIQVTRVDPLTGASGCNTAFLQALQGTVWENYFLVSTQWLNQHTEGPPFTPVVTPATLRNTVIETYLVDWKNNQQVSTSSCIGCHQGGVDFSYIFGAPGAGAAKLAQPAAHP
ncbi:MAG TPA: hypothetical protein VF756_02050 [Thermoanaerobaculia bacterium]